MKRLYFHTAYDDPENVCGFIVARYSSDTDQYYITKDQYKRALKKRTIGGDAGLVFHTDKDVIIFDLDVSEILGRKVII